jgi:hypothetical protein
VDNTLYAKNILLDDSVGDNLDQSNDKALNDSSMSNLAPNATEESQLESSKARILKNKLLMLRERRRER